MKPSIINPSLITFLLLFLIPVEVMSEENGAESGIFDHFRERIDVSVLSELEWASGIGEVKSQKQQWMLVPELSLGLPFDVKLTTIGRLRGELVDKLEPGSPPQSEVSRLSRRIMIRDSLDLELREFYFEATLGRTFLTIGKQQIVWGKADGLKVLDVVNPQDFREFILDDVSDSRIPLWAVNVEIPIGEVTAQLVWIPDRTYHALPEPDSIYKFTSPMLIPTPPPGVEINLLTVERPGHFFTSSDVGGRFSTFWKGWDLTVNYLYHYNDFPTLFRELSMTQKGSPVTVTPRYQRTHLIGGTVSNAFGSLILRGEAGFSFDRYLETNDPMDTDGVVKTNELGYVLGLDWNGISKTFMSFQLFQTLQTSEKPQLLRDQIDTNLTLLLRRTFLSDSLMTEIRWLQNINHGDSLVRPFVRYELSDDFNVFLGADLFYGRMEGLFGQFDENDRVIGGIEQSF